MEQVEEIENSLNNLLTLIHNTKNNLKKNHQNQQFKLKTPESKSKNQIGKRKNTFDITGINKSKLKKFKNRKRSDSAENKRKRSESVDNYTSGEKLKN